MKQWIKQQLAELDDLNEFNETTADDLRSVICEAERGGNGRLARCGKGMPDSHRRRLTCICPEHALRVLGIHSVRAGEVRVHVWAAHREASGCISQCQPEDNLCRLRIKSPSPFENRRRAGHDQNQQG